MKSIKLFLCLIALMGIALSAPAQNPAVFAFYAGWNTAPVPDTKFTAVFPAFAEMRQNANGYWTDYSNSGYFQNWGTTAYTKTNQWASKYADYVHDTGKLYVSYGGGSNSDFRTMVINASDAQIDAMAGEIKANIQSNFFTGVDLDIEGWWLYSNAEDNRRFARNLAKLVKILRTSLDGPNGDAPTYGARIVVSVGITSSGYLFPQAWFGSYDGTMLPFFQDTDAMNAIQYVNIMGYNSGRANFYSEYGMINDIITSYKDAVGPANIKKLIFGIQPVETAGRPITSAAEIQALASQVIAPSGIGGMSLWAIGASELGGMDPGSYIAAMKAGLGYQD